MKKHKVIVIGLPKTGTSTLAAMLRMLGYNVTGPEIKYAYGNYIYLDQQFQSFDAFQDFPWCFEWQRYFEDSNVKYIILRRDSESWWKSFLESYGKTNHRYLSYPYINLLKTPDNKDNFINFFNNYYVDVDQFARRFPNRFLSLEIHDFKWDDLCNFLGQPIPRTIFGHIAKKPHVNKQKFKAVHTNRYKVLNTIKKKLVFVIGKEKWHNLIVLMRKNNLLK